MYRLIFLYILLVSGCRVKDLSLIKCDIKKWDKIDTIEVSNNIAILRLIDERSMGDFKTDYAIGKIGGTFYRISHENGEGVRFSKDYVAFNKNFGVTNWGWFYVENGQLNTDLPDIDIVLDSLSKKYPPNKFFFRTTNGYVDVLQNGELITTVNYGTFFPGLNQIQFDKLDYKLFKKEKDRLIKISDSVDSVYFQPAGVYFIPSPGYGLVSKFDKREIFSVIDSVSEMKNSPDLLTFESSK